MTEEIDHDVEESAGESGVLKALRSQVRDLEKELKARPAREDLEAQLRNQLKREQAAAALLVERGQPQGLAEFMLSKIGDADVTGETVAEFLKGLGYDAEPVSADASTQVPSNQQLAEVTNLANRVSAAAGGASAESVQERLSKTQNIKEVEAIMAEIGAVQS